MTPRQREIVDAARTLLVDEGVEAVTLGRIAHALEIKPPSLYKHFVGKRDIEAALIAEGFERFTAALEQTSGLADMAAAYRAFALANPQLYRLMTERPLARDLLPDGLEARAAAPLQRAAGDEDLARAVWAFAHGMVALELAARFPETADLTAAWDAGVRSFARSRGEQ